MDNSSFQLVFMFIVMITVLVIIHGILKLLNKIWKNLEKTEKLPTFPLTFFINNFKLKGDFTMLQLKNNQLARFVVGAPTDIKGDETTVQAGSLQVTSSNEEVFKVERDEKDPDNEMAWKVVAGRKGAAVLSIAADADLGDGVKTISTEIAVEVTSSEAVGFGEPSFVIEDQVIGETEGQPGPDAGTQENLAGAAE